jgi:hypothetical protein
MIEAKPVETLYEQDGIRYCHITVLVTVRTEATGVKQKHMAVYSGLDNQFANTVRRDLGMPIK